MGWFEDGDKKLYLHDESHLESCAFDYYYRVYLSPLNSFL